MSLPQIRTDYWALTGGLNTMTPPLVMPPGFTILSQNFEQDTNGGYRRTAGYERFDGRPSPSEQFYYTLPATIVGAWAPGNTLTGLSSGATAKILDAGLIGFYLANISGTFGAGEDLQISGATVATCDGDAFLGGAASIAIEGSLLADAADVYRSLIGAVPGSGPVRGVCAYKGSVYAFRDNAGGTACDMYKSSVTGWTRVALGYQLAFTTGVGQINEGDTVTGATSGASAVATRVMRRDGAWGSTAVGTLVFAAVTGTFVNGEALRVGGVTKATASGGSSAITLAPGGRYKFVINNFFGGAGTVRMYGCSGENKAFEFDGSVYAPISTGMTNDKPRFIAAHKNHLFLLFDSSLQHSGVGDAYAWSPISGAGELALGDTGTNLAAHVGDANNGTLVCTTRNTVFVLYGNSAADWKLVSTEGEMGALPYSAQKIGDMFWLDDRGVTSMAAVFQYGNFQQATITRNIQSWIREKRLRCTESCISRERNQYRLFFSDRYALYITFSGGKMIGMAPMLFENDVTCCWSGEWTDGSERIFFGSSDGYVRQMDAGTSFDGASIDAYFTTAYNSLKSPNINKRFWKAVLEILGDSYVEFNFGYELGYGQTTISQPTPQTMTSNLAPTIWDNFTWDTFFWDGRNLAPSELSVTGTGENIALTVATNSRTIKPFTITGALLHYTPRRRLR